MPSRNELLVEHYLKVAGIVVVSIDEAGAISTHATVHMEVPPGSIAFCCAGGDENYLAQLLTSCSGDQAAVAARLDQLAYDMGLGLTPLDVVAQRALAAVEMVNATISDMQATGGMKKINAAFKAARKETPSLRYHDYLHAQKAMMLEALAKEQSTRDACKKLRPASSE